MGEEVEGESQSYVQIGGRKQYISRAAISLGAVQEMNSMNLFKATRVDYRRI